MKQGSRKLSKTSLNRYLIYGIKSIHKYYCDLKNIPYDFSIKMWGKKDTLTENIVIHLQFLSKKKNSCFGVWCQKM